MKILQNIFSDKKYLFLDRDGVINKRIVGGYITSWEDFEFLPGVLDSMATISGHFDKICIITNQQGIGKGLMSHEDVENIHQSMKHDIEEAGGRIDGIYYCSKLKDAENNCRKPGVFMALAAQKEFPEIVWEESIMIGDTRGDMEFAKNAGMTAVLLVNEFTEAKDRELADDSIQSLIEISKLIK